MLNLFKFLHSVSTLSDALRDRLEDELQYLLLGKNTWLLFEGQICSNIYFLEAGLLRVFYKKDQKEISSCFAFEGELCSSFASFFYQKHARENIRAIEPSGVWYIDHTQYRSFITEFPEFNAICRTLMAQCWERNEIRMQAMWMRPGEDRYRWLLKEWGDKFNRIPPKYISSYMGISEQMLSKLKNGHV